MATRDIRLQPSNRTTGQPLVRPRRGSNVERRVLDAALELAAHGGFEAVRQRDVADRAGVALGTLYKRFRSKDELLIGVLEVESQKLANRLEREPPLGATSLERVTSYFALSTYYLVRKPRLGRAILRAVTSGGHVSERMMTYHARQMGHVVAALRPREPLSAGGGELKSDEECVLVATILLQVWFAALVGWSGGIFDSAAVVDQVKLAARVVLLGLREEPPSSADGPLTE
jgi:AcrR family transcriptional regulator